MTRGGHGRTLRTDTPAPLRYLAGVTGLVGATAALIAAVAGLLTAAATLTEDR
ncbi:hypothetical protein ABZ780_22100 [Micromonospora sp. NPDC047467]|uniref:hypothetical protein n=1 Tax=Micromonospora sp. NPDC047467 TaxID=3154814 RepID=UPI0033CCFDAC